VSDLFVAYRNELGRIFTLRPVFSVIVLASLIYAAVYPQPYLNEALSNVPMALVDLDRTTSSRDLARRLDATSDVAVAMVLPDLANAQRAVYERAAFGILVIPQHFERDLLHGRASPIALYADASYFLIYQRVSGAVSAVARAFGAEIEINRLIGIGVDAPTASAAADPLVLTAVPLFNPQGGYGTYLLPAALVLILQQTLLIGVGLLGTLSTAQVHASNSASRTSSASATVSGKLLAYLTVEVAIVPFYLLGLPYLYGLPRLGSVTTILGFALPFVLSVGALGVLVAALFRKPLVVQLVFAPVGLPVFFLAGFAWPTETIPESIRLIAKLLPSTSAIDGLVKIGQLGASLSDVRGEFLTLWGLAAFYGCVAILLERRKSRAIPRARYRSTIPSTVFRI